MNNLNKPNKPLVISLIFFWSIYVVYISVPAIVFYFDQTEGIATNIELRPNKVRFTYVNMLNSVSYDIEKKMRYTKQRKLIENSNSWPILYSKKFPGRVTLVGVEAGPILLYPLLLIAFTLIPIVGFKNLDFDDKRKSK